MPILSLIPILLQFLMALPELILTAEKAFSGTPNVSGAAKKALVMQVVKTGSNVAVQAGQLSATHQALIETTVGQAIEVLVPLLKAPELWAATAGGPQEGV